MSILLAGGTGVIGQALLDQASHATGIGRNVVIFNRQGIRLSGNMLEQIILSEGRGHVIQFAEKSFRVK